MCTHKTRKRNRQPPSHTEINRNEVTNPSHMWISLLYLHLFLHLRLLFHLFFFFVTFFSLFLIQYNFLSLVSLTTTSFLPCLVEQPTIVILCHEHECQDNETVELFQNITCMANSLANEVIEMQVNGVTVGVAENNYTYTINETQANVTLLLVVCNTSSNANDTVFVQLHIGNVGRL